MYTDKQKKQALEVYDEVKSVTRVIQRLEYPSRQTLYKWINNRGVLKKERSPRKQYNNTPNHILHPSYEIKLDAIRRCFEEGENVQWVSEKIGYSRASI